MNSMTFGEFLKAKRIETKQSLRSFSKNNNFDAAYISRLENSLMAPPEDEDKLEAIGKSVNIKKGTTEWDTFAELASVSRIKIPSELTESNPNIVNVLPAFLRTAAKKDISEQDVKDLLQLLKGEE